MLMPVIPALRRLRQEECRVFGASLSYTSERSRGSPSLSPLSPQALLLLVTGTLVGSFSLALIIFDWVNNEKHNFLS